MNTIIPVVETGKEYNGCPFAGCGSDLRELRTLPVGTVLFEEGDPSRCLYCLHEGRIAVSRRDPEGVLRVAALVEPGDFLAANCLGNDSLHTSTAVSIQESLVCIIPRGVLLEVMKADWRLAGRLMQGMCSSLERAESHFGPGT